MRAGAWSAWSRRTPTCSTARSRRTCAWPSATPPSEELDGALAAARLLDWTERAAGGPADRGRRARRAHLRRSAPAPGDRASAARRLPRADPRRARRAPRHAHRRCDRRRPADDHRGSDDAADHAPADRAAGRRRGAGARPRPRARTRHARRAGGSRRALRRAVAARAAMPSGLMCLARPAGRDAPARSIRPCPACRTRR